MYAITCEKFVAYYSSHYVRNYICNYVKEVKYVIAKCHCTIIQCEYIIQESVQKEREREREREREKISRIC
jgi:hypothetical protein